MTPLDFDMIDIREEFISDNELYVKLSETKARHISSKKVYVFDAESEVYPVEKQITTKSEQREGARIKDTQMSVSGKSVFTMEDAAKKRSLDIEKARLEKVKNQDIPD